MIAVLMASVVDILLKHLQKVVISGGRIDLGSQLGVSELVRDLVGFAELALDLDEEGDHARLRAALGRAAQSSKYGCRRQGPAAHGIVRRGRECSWN